MGCEYGIAYIRYGGEIDFTHIPVVYVGGEIGELTLDSDTASYAEVRDYLKDKGYVDSDFKIFYNAPHKGFQHLYSDSSSLEFGGLIHKNGDVDVFVQHGIGVNENFVHLGSGSGLSENFVYDWTDIKVGSGSGVSDNFVYDGTDVKVGSGSGVRQQINDTESEDESDGSDETYGTKYARYLQEREKYSKDNASGGMAETQVPTTYNIISNIGTPTQFEVRSSSKKTRVAPKSKGLGLAPPPLPPGHSHWKGRGLTYNPDGRSGVSVDQIKKMRSPRKSGGASGWSSSTEKL